MRRSLSRRTDPRPSLAALVLFVSCARPSPETPKLVWRDLEVDESADDAHRFAYRERVVRVSFRWEVPETAAFRDIGHDLDRFAERGIAVDRIRAFQSFREGLAPPDLREPAEKAARDLLPDEGKASPEKADIIVRITRAELGSSEQFVCGNQRYGTPVFAAYLQAEGKNLKGEPFQFDAPGAPCRIEEGNFETCLEESIREAVEYLFHNLGAQTPRPPPM